MSRNKPTRKVFYVIQHLACPGKWIDCALPKGFANIESALEAKQDIRSQYHFAATRIARRTVIDEIVQGTALATHFGKRR